MGLSATIGPPARQNCCLRRHDIIVERGLRAFRAIYHFRARTLRSSIRHHFSTLLAALLSMLLTLFDTPMPPGAYGAITR